MRRDSIWIIFILLYVCVLGSPAFAQDSSDIQSLLSSDGNVLFGRDTNSIMVTDYPENIKKVEEYLKMADIIPKQVLIEARIVEVKLQGENAFGINWQKFAERGGLGLGQFTVGTTQGGAIEQNIPFKPTFYPAGSTLSTDQETPFTLTIFDDDITMVVNALGNTYDTNILSAPRVTAVNTHTAEIKMVRELRWVVPDVQVDEGVVSISWTEGEGSPREVGILLEVTPMITDDDQISMVLEPEVSEHVSDIELVAIADTAQVPYTIPIIDTRVANTKVVVGNRQTLIIGGLMKEKNVKGITKVPLLGDIPGVGWLFKSQKDVKEKSELLIFVSPTIINPDVMSKMKRRETEDIGKWYMQAREAREKALEAAEVLMERKKTEDLFSSKLRSLEKETLKRTVMDVQTTVILPGLKIPGNGNIEKNKEQTK
ncbi:MAG: hypothetical protein L6416_03495 [Candidatus Omnitrophica bacterium]|nr:hypothetical protein [Candidatus Omnitrophota bacterium]